MIIAPLSFDMLIIAQHPTVAPAMFLLPWSDSSMSMLYYHIAWRILLGNQA